MLHNAPVFCQAYLEWYNYIPVQFYDKVYMASYYKATGCDEILGGQCFMITEVDPMDPLAPCGVHLVIFLSVKRSNLLSGSDDHHHRHPRQAVYLRRNRGSDP